MREGNVSEDCNPTTPVNALLGLSAHEAEAILHQLAGQKLDAPPLRQSYTDAREPAADRGNHNGPERPFTRPVHHAPLLAADTFLGLLEAMPDAIVIVDAVGQIVQVNLRTEILFGYQRNELVGQPVELLIPPRFRDGHVITRDAYIASPHVRPMGKGLELMGLRKDGHEVPVEISLSPLRTPEGLLVVSSIRDVTERRKAEGQLRKMEKRYRTLVEGIPAVTFMAPMDEGPGELYVSPQIEELLGFSQREWLENPILWYTQLHPDDQGRWHEEFSHTVATGEPFRSVYRFVAKDGQIVWVHGEAHMVKDDDGQPLFLQGVAFDVTGIKEAEERLKASNATLEERVAERTAEAEQRSRELERSNIALKEFALVAAHDLSEPLRTMQTKIQQIAERFAREYPGHVVPAIEEAISRGLKAGYRMKTLIDDLFAFSKVRIEGKQPLPIACAKAFTSARDSLEVRIAETSAEVTADELPEVLADAGQLTQVFQNLISNSLKFRAEDRTPRVHVSAHRERTEWVIAVTDNGIGIDGPKALAKIFKLGVESRQHSREKYPGSGVGLATCERIIDRHGGRIWAASDGTDRGTTISFTLPAV
jgi:PAS domain S-box-containing protein